MMRILSFFSVTIFSIFLGSQITEGCLLAPYWKTLSSAEFYDYYSKFGPLIARFYSILTITAVLIPLSVSIYCFIHKSPALKHSLLSTLFAFLVIVLFYSYFKQVNQQFYTAAFSPNELKSVLETWENWHWLRVGFEVLSLLLLSLSLNILIKKRD